MRPTFFAALAFLTITSCATPETRLRNGLVNAGLSPRTADCMAGRMVDRLSLLQLRRLSSLSGLEDDNLRELSIDQFLHKVRALRDPEILAVTTRAGVGCAIGL